MKKLEELEQNWYGDLDHLTLDQEKTTTKLIYSSVTVGAVSGSLMFYYAVESGWLEKIYNYNLF